MHLRAQNLFSINKQYNFPLQKCVSSDARLTKYYDFITLSSYITSETKAHEYTYALHGLKFLKFQIWPLIHQTNFYLYNAKYAFHEMLHRYLKVRKSYFLVIRIPAAHWLNLVPLNVWTKKFHDICLILRIMHQWHMSNVRIYSKITITTHWCYYFSTH